MSIPRVTIPMRPKTPAPYAPGDLITVARTRWRIRSMNRTTGRVVLEAMNTTNHAEWWNTTLDKLPRRTA